MKKLLLLSLSILLFSCGDSKQEEEEVEDINKLYNDGKISIAEADKLRKGGGIEDNGISRKIRDGKSDKKREIIKLYKEGGLSISDTIAYENNLLLERNLQALRIALNL